MDEEQRRKISETIRQRWKEGKQKLPKKCTICSCFLGKNHSCKKVKEKQSKAKLENPVKYWLGKERVIPQEVRQKMIDGINKTQKFGEEHHSWIGGSSIWWHKEARKIMANKLDRELESTEIVHHIDGNWKNNDLSNLVITNRSEHATIHHKGVPKPRRIK